MVFHCFAFKLREKKTKENPNPTKNQEILSFLGEKILQQFEKRVGLFLVAKILQNLSGNYSKYSLLGE